MENKVSEKIINTTYNEAKKILNVLNDFMIDIKNNKLQKLCLNVAGELELVVDECKILIKSYKKELDEINFFDKYQALISLKLSHITKKSTVDLAEIFFVTVSECLPTFYSFLFYNDLDEVVLVKKMIKNFEQFLENLKPFFVCVE